MKRIHKHITIHHPPHNSIMQRATTEICMSVVALSFLMKLDNNPDNRQQMTIRSVLFVLGLNFPDKIARGQWMVITNFLSSIIILTSFNDP